MNARRLSRETVAQTLQYGREIHVRGAVIFAIGRKEVEHAKRFGVDLTRGEGVQVICSRDGGVMTVYRNRDFRSLRPRRRFRG